MGWKWVARIPRLFKFIDDGTIVTKINMHNAEVDRGEVEKRRKRDLATEQVFNRTIARAEGKGMKVNLEKTALLLMSSANSYEPQGYFLSKGEELCSSSDQIRILGFYLDGSPTVAAHMTELIAKVRRRLWILRHLLKFGFTKEELVQVYCSMIRSVMEFCSVIYHSYLTLEQCKKLEQLQIQALKCIYGFGKTGKEMLECSGLETLEERRKQAFLKFAKKTAEGNYSGWFPKREGGRALRNGNVYLEEYSRCDRLYNSPIYAMRRALNEQARQEQL
jgi:hypothetical protein